MLLARLSQLATTRPELDLNQERLTLILPPYWMVVLGLIELGQEVGDFQHGDLQWATRIF